MWFDLFWADSIQCCSDRSDSIRCYSIRTHSIWFRPIQPLLVWLYVIRVCVLVFLIRCVLVQFALGWFEVICLYMIRCGLIQFDEVWFYSIRFDSMQVHGIQFDLCCFGAMWFHLGLIHVIRCRSVWLALTQCLCLTRFDLFLSVSMHFDLIHVYLIVQCNLFNLIWFDSMWSDSSLMWFVSTWFYEVGVDSGSFCLIQVSSMLVGLIWFECWWFYSIWFALIRLDLIQLTFCENICFCNASSFSHVF